MGLEGSTAHRRREFFTRAVVMHTPRFIRAMHPKKGILPEPGAIQRVLDSGWVGQAKIHGHRCQLHVPADRETGVVAYTRHGKFHTKRMTEAMVAEVRRLFSPHEDWNVIDAESNSFLK